MSDFLYYNSSVRKMESAALILGIISVVTCLILYISIPCGALAIMFAFLSRGGNYKMSEKAIAGLWVGIAGIILTFIIYTFTFFFLLGLYGSIDGILNAYSTNYGITFQQ